MNGFDPGDWLWQKTKQIIWDEVKQVGQNIKGSAKYLAEAAYNDVRDELVVPLLDSGRAAMGIDPTGHIPYLEKAPAITDMDLLRARSNMKSAAERLRNVYSSANDSVGSVVPRYTVLSGLFFIADSTEH